MPIRRQLTLFAAADEARAIEALRRELDPVQQALIAAHVTLARDEEVAEWTAATLRERLQRATPPPCAVTLRFGRAEAFAGHGILLPCRGGEPEFAALRRALLGATGREQHPHLTLAHPRNPKAPGNSLARAQQLPAELVLAFATVCLIEQVDATLPWQTIAEQPLAR